MLFSKQPCFLSKQLGLGEQLIEHFPQRLFSLNTTSEEDLAHSLISHTALLYLHSILLRKLSLPKQCHTCLLPKILRGPNLWHLAQGRTEWCHHLWLNEPAQC